ncbi:MAG: hypothetical protein IPJ06_19865 [Saprospiraceae bacterium]|nr:hypothetical protein [Saprospiraceae bacterium]
MEYGVMCCSGTDDPDPVYGENAYTSSTDRPAKILRYASLDDIAIWGVLAPDPHGLDEPVAGPMFLLCFGFASVLFRKLIRSLPEQDRWYAGLI